MLSDDLKKVLALLHKLNPIEELESEFFEKELTTNTQELLDYLEQSQSSADEEKNLALIHARSRALNLEQLYSEFIDVIEEEIKKASK